MDSRDFPPRIAPVPFCNAWPLIRYLGEELPKASFTSVYPSQMREKLLSGEIDLALMPVAELLHLPEYRIYGNVCIGARGPVESVLLYSRVPVPEIRRLALDRASRSSITLAQVIFREYYRTEPETVPLDLECELNECDCDAFVVIGDRALTFEPKKCWEYRIDLAQWWIEKTGLPFVFAAWIGRKEMRFDEDSSAKIVNALQKSRDRGIHSLPSLVAEKVKEYKTHPSPFFTSEHRILNYLRHSVYYYLGNDEKRGLELFLNLAGKFRL